MKNILLSFVIAITAISCSQAQKTEFSPEALQSKMIATDKSETTFQKVLEKNKGKIIVIDVWASWCADCIKGFSKYKELQEKYPDATYLYISMDKTWEKWIVGAEFHQLKGQHFWVEEGMKGVFGKSIDLDWIPRYMVVDQKGAIALYKATEADDPKLAEALKKLYSKKKSKSKK
ncbi:thioredoxin-like domain-containing protein [Flavobacterium sp.]|uniref:TlpA family protein disulfide reductase n=1 Tax=Flavobacterium sp. TaxID=239 RepID=UPI00260331F3|nr:thioredoxin-like domain-containing protein [Flavobacterium sp.]MDD3005263.1 thioredoxin-like domain-containing protein [Flavobacterium sp.]